MNNVELNTYSTQLTSPSEEHVPYPSLTLIIRQLSILLRASWSFEFRAPRLSSGFTSMLSVLSVGLYMLIATGGAHLA